jgi:hypothetical protein
MTTDAAERYARLVAAMRLGERPAMCEIERTLAVAGRSPMQLLADVFPASADELPTQPGDACAACGGRIIVANSKRRGSLLVQYLRCGECRQRPPRAKRHVLAAAVPRRPRKRRAVEGQEAES